MHDKRVQESPTPNGFYLFGLFTFPTAKPRHGAEELE